MGTSAQIIQLSGDGIPSSGTADTQSITPPGPARFTLEQYLKMVDRDRVTPVCVFYYHSTINVDQSSRLFNLKNLSSDGQ
jgi:hypothetical protein